MHFDLVHLVRVKHHEVVHLVMAILIVGIRAAHLVEPTIHIFQFLIAFSLKCLYYQIYYPTE
jgi:hypothetical protein